MCIINKKLSRRKYFYKIVIKKNGKYYGCVVGKLFNKGINIAHANIKQKTSTNWLWTNNPKIGITGFQTYNEALKCLKIQNYLFGLHGLVIIKCKTLDKIYDGIWKEYRGSYKAIETTKCDFICEVQ